MKGISAEDFASIAIQIKDWMTVEDILSICDEQGFWSHEFIEESLDEIKRVAIRRFARKKSYKDIDGNPIELVSVLQFDPEKKATVRAYKQLSLFDETDYVHVITDRYRRRQYWDTEIKRFVMLAYKNHGDSIQLRLPFLNVKECLGGPRGT